MTRIIAGRAGGRRLQTPRGGATRPTSDRVREALFSTLESRVGPLAGLRFLDLYAGSGAVGLEAWSRGAGVVTLVEHDRRTAALVSANARALGAVGASRAEVVVGAVGAVLDRPPGAPYDVVFSDPPYPLAPAEVDADLVRVTARGWLVPGGLVVVERSVRSPAPTWPAGLEPEREKRYGETVLWYGRAAPPPPDPRGGAGPSDQQHPDPHLPDLTDEE
ncbi:16S rRNA (guanine(966)-N(2))-methyltransferase RsmD [Nocardioides perillae]|uniref:16S rRNA (Guanine966-N2)-methyltransferase n=1 Tax=Nocardioides perillae TaxID=1119534 RepID=A0A7Y9RXB9_9ACTN|nr:16S rRNA (guanine966-N2)-methyltransferase [Nocardioides perillae]